jgi:hypothetical protein
LAISLPWLQLCQCALRLSHGDVISMVTLDCVDDILAFDPGIHVEELGYFT